MSKVVVLKSTGEELGKVLTNHSMTDDEIIELAGIKVMRTEDDYMSGDGYDYEDLEIVERD